MVSLRNILDVLSGLKALVLPLVLAGVLALVYTFGVHTGYTSGTTETQLKCTQELIQKDEAIKKAELMARKSSQTNKTTLKKLSDPELIARGTEWLR